MALHLSFRAPQRSVVVVNWMVVEVCWLTQARTSPQSQANGTQNLQAADGQRPWGGVQRRVNQGSESRDIRHV